MGKSVGEGTGLGLWISFPIVQNYAWAITVRNSEAGGTEFGVVPPFDR